MTDIYRTYQFSHKNGREENQDSKDVMVGTTAPTDTDLTASVLYVADGVSDSDGTRAAKIIERDARKVMAKLLANAYDLAQMPKDAREKEVLAQLKEAILELDSYMRPVNTCRSTISLAFVLGSFVYTANLGDSPILLLRLDSDDVPYELLEAYTCQNMAGIAVAAGRMTKEEALTSPLKNIVKGEDLLGSRPGREAISTNVVGLGQNNLLLLGSDGALSVVSDDILMELVEENIDEGLDVINDALFEAVKAAGGDDNYTLVLQWIQCS